METTFIQGSFKFEVLDEKKKTVRIMRKSVYENLSGKLVIPSSVTNKGTTYKVVEIGGYAQEYQPAVYEKIPDKRTASGYRYGKTISDSKSGIYAFEGTEIIELVIPNTITKIDWAAFRGCKKLAKVTIPSSVEVIGGCAFWSCYALTSVTISQGVKTIGDSAFGFTKIKKITIPSSVDKIGDDTFVKCESLSEAIILDSDGIISIGKGAFPGNCKVIYESQMGFFGKLFKR